MWFSSNQYRSTYHHPSSHHSRRHLELVHRLEGDCLQNEPSTAHITESTRARPQYIWHVIDREGPGGYSLAECIISIVHFSSSHVASCPSPSRSAPLDSSIDFFSNPPQSCHGYFRLDDHTTAQLNSPVLGLHKVHRKISLRSEAL